MSVYVLVYTYIFMHVCVVLREKTWFLNKRGKSPTIEPSLHLFLLNETSMAFTCNPKTLSETRWRVGTVIFSFVRLTYLFNRTELSKYHLYFMYSFFILQAMMCYFYFFYLTFFFPLVGFPLYNQIYFSIIFNKM